MSNAITIVQTTSAHADFIALVQQLDAYLAIMDGDEHAFYHQYNHIQNLQYVVVAYVGGVAVGCGAIKPFSNGIMEVKRMFTSPRQRGKGVATTILQALETWAKQLGYTTCILETGIRQKEAVALYPRCGYERIPNYGQYAGVANSLCFQKQLG
jgi:GNAT superfamily N-acetyltransferase